MGVRCDVCFIPSSGADWGVGLNKNPFVQTSFPPPGHDQDLSRGGGFARLLRPVQGVDTSVNAVLFLPAQPPSLDSSSLASSPRHLSSTPSVHTGRPNLQSTPVVHTSQNILKQTPTPMTPLESLASSAVRTAHKVGRSPLDQVLDLDPPMARSGRQAMKRQQQHSAPP